MLRDGERRRVPAARLVPGDVLLLEEGSTVPADARVFEAYTEIGAVAGLLSRTSAEETPLQRELELVGRLLGRIVVAIALVVAVTIVLVQQVRTLPALVSVLLLAVALAVAAVPEGLTAITTIVLSLGTERMARRRVIIRKLSAVQALGSATVICSDKTGTLTKNEMTVRVAITAGGRTDFTGTG